VGGRCSARRLKSISGPTLGKMLRAIASAFRPSPRLNQRVPRVIQLIKPGITARVPALSGCESQALNPWTLLCAENHPHRWLGAHRKRGRPSGKA
jgi:hypothetical protein